ncbi:MAG: hypothetical protein ACKOXM_08120 [Agromyces sp.]
MHSVTSMVGAGVAIVALAVAGLWPVAQGNWPVALFALPVSALTAWVFWIVLARPALYYDRNRVVIVNFLRTHSVPWPAVESISQRLNMVFTLKNGLRITAVGVPYPKKGNLMGAREMYVNYDGDTSVLEDFRANAVDRGLPETHNWDRVHLRIGIALIVLTVIATVIGSF